MPEEHYLMESIVPTLEVVVEFIGEGIMVWKCFSGFELVSVSVKGNVNAPAYKVILAIVCC